MKIDSKMRRIQQKYRQEIEQKSEKKKHTLEAVFVIFFIILLVQLSVFLGGKFPFNDAKNIPIDVNNFEKRWMEVTVQIDDTLKNMSVEYMGIAIDFNPKPTKLILKTSFQESNLNVDDKLNKLINVSNEMIKSNNLSTLLKENETYEIIVKGKNKEELTRNVFHNSEGL